MIGAHLSYEQYAALPGLRWSVLREMGESPRHCRYAETHDTDTASRVWLRAVHAAVLEGRQDYVVWRGAKRAGKEWDLFRACHPGATILTETEAGRLRDVADAVRSHPVVSQLLAQGRPEVTVTWGDYKGRIDWLGPDYLIDLKTLGTTDTRRVARMIAQQQYHGQLAHYRDGLRANGVDVRRVYLVVAEGSDAQDVAVYDIDDRALDVGLRLRDQYAARYRECAASGIWPGRHPEIAPIGLPDWAVEEE